MIDASKAPLESINRSTFKPAAHQNDRLVQLQMKEVDKDDDFSLDESKSDLNLSSSNHLTKGEFKDRDSLIFHLEPDKKKGMSVTSKHAKYNNRSSEMIDIRDQNNLTSGRNTVGSHEMVQINNTLYSK